MRLSVIVLFLLIAEPLSSQIYLPKFDVQGHRGCRGLMPENSLPAFIAAVDSGVTTLEMDVVITKDNQVVVSHDPFMSAAFCLDPDGKPIKEKDEKKYNIYKMTYEQVKAWDAGSKVNPKFPEQQKIKVSKPLLRDVIIAVENHIKNYTRYEVDYNIELKGEPEGDNKFHPRPEAFCELVYSLVDAYLPMERVVFQSFDIRHLQYLHKKYPNTRLSLLVENLNTIDENITKLGFTPRIYSPDYTLLTREEVKHCHDLKMRVIPWTVNDEKEMVELKGMGVDGFITDYPNRAAKYKMTLSIKRADAERK